MSTIYKFPYDSHIRYLPLVYLLPYDLLLRFPTLCKLPQNKIAVDYDVILKMGDNLNDFQRVYYVEGVEERAELMAADKELFGTEFILLPNPTDGHWIKAIFGESEPVASDENRALWKEAAEYTVWSAPEK